MDLEFRDVQPGADDLSLTVELAQPSLTAEEIIRGRVAAELARGGFPRPLSEAGEAERALRAFSRGRFALIVDGVQVQGLDEVVELTPASDVTFLRLVPLAGG